MDGTTGRDLLNLDEVHAVLTYKAVTRLRIRILPPDGKVAVSAPFDTPEHVVERFVNQHHDWILRAQADVRLRSPRPERLVTGGRVRLWGAWTELVVGDAPRASARRVEGRIHIHRPANDEAAAGRAMNSLYRRELDPALQHLMERWEPRVGRRAEGTKLRRMTSRWGSCNTFTGVITFNTALAKFPQEALEFVVVHELVHLLERGHGQVFKAHMSRLLPDWPARRQLLKDGP